MNQSNVNAMSIEFTESNANAMFIQLIGFFGPRLYSRGFISGLAPRTFPYIQGNDRGASPEMNQSNTNAMSIEFIESNANVMSI